MIGRASARLALASALVACGAGTGLPAGELTGSPDAGLRDAALVTSPCPTVVPDAGAPCTMSPSIACEVGTDVDSACNTSFVCSSGAWSVAAPSSTATCPTPAATAQCPSSYASAPVGTACEDPDLTCGYPEGWCLCTASVSGPAQPANHYDWQCDRPAAGCPTPRPDLGTLCTLEGESCNYGSCTLPQGVVEQCTGGLWEPVASACPAARFP